MKLNENESMIISDEAGKVYFTILVFSQVSKMVPSPQVSPVTISISIKHATFPSHLSLFIWITLLIIGKQYKL